MPKMKPVVAKTPMALAKALALPAADAREWLLSHGLAKPDDQVVLVFASGSACEQPDTLRTTHLSKDECTG